MKLLKSSDNCSILRVRPVTVGESCLRDCMVARCHIILFSVDMICNTIDELLLRRCAER